MLLVDTRADRGIASRSWRCSMVKIFEYLFGLLFIICVIEFMSNPKEALRAIQRGPMPNLSKFNDSLVNPSPINRVIHKHY